MITTITSGADIKVGHAVKMSGSTVVPITSASDTVVGVAVQKVASGRPCAVQVGGRARVAIRNNPAVAQEAVVTVDGSADVLYRITINGENVDFTGSSNSITEIRDGLIAAAQVLELDDILTITTVSTDAIKFVAKEAGTAFTITVNAAVTLSGEVANVASVAFPKGAWGTFADDGVGVPDTDGVFKTLEDAAATEDGFCLVLCELFPAEVAG